MSVVGVVVVRVVIGVVTVRVVVVRVFIEEEGDVEVQYFTCVSQPLVTSGMEVGVVIDGRGCECSGNVEGGDGALGGGCEGIIHCKR